jgi:hypothetical protein
MVEYKVVNTKRAGVGDAAARNRLGRGLVGLIGLSPVSAESQSITTAKGP